MDDASSEWLSKVKRTEMRSQWGWGVDSQPGRWRQRWHWVVGPWGTEKMLTSSRESTAALTIQLQPWLFQLTFSRLSKIWEIWGTVLLSKKALKEWQVMRKRKKKSLCYLMFINLFFMFSFYLRLSPRNCFVRQQRTFQEMAFVGSVEYTLAAQSPFIIKTLPFPLPRTICHIFNQQSRYTNSLRQLKRQIHNPNMQNRHVIM